MTAKADGTPGWTKSVLVLVLLVGVPAAMLLAVRALQGPHDPAIDHMNRGLRFIVGFVVALLGCLLTLGGYLLVLFTSCFTFNFARPVYRGFKRKLYVANIIVPTGLMVAAAGFLDALLVAVTFAIGLDPPPWWGTVAPALILANFATAIVNVWSPVGARLVAKRLAAQGISQHQIRSGIRLGVSDPARNDWTKMVMQDDVGMLWIDPGLLTYRGDADEFSVTPAELSEIERVSVSASLLAYFGVRHIGLHLQDGRRIRLHVDGEWTLPGVRRATDRLADRLARWKAAGGGLRTAASA